MQKLTTVRKPPVTTTKKCECVWCGNKFTTTVRAVAWEDKLSAAPPTCSYKCRTEMAVIA